MPGAAAMSPMRTRTMTSRAVVTHSLYLIDPDGNEVELYIDVPGVDWKNDPSVMLAPPRPPLQL
jgi:catechol-2,3-dioxygenase